jgi:aromatic-L-amino-acid decarboxylase
MDNEEFRRYGHQVVDWIGDYLDDIRQYPVLPDMQPGDLVDRLPARAPDHGEPMDAIRVFTPISPFRPRIRAFLRRCWRAP